MATQVHLAFAGRDPGSGARMAVSWRTETKTPSVVHFGPGGTLSRNISGTSSCYLKDSGWHHHAVLDGLSAGEYTYRIDTSSETRTFRTAAESINQTIRYGMFGDMGFLNSTARPMLIHVSGLHKNWSASHTRDRVLEHARNGLIDAVWHLGDIGYADDAFAHHPLEPSYEAAYDGFMNWIEPIAARIPYQVSPGNHESECHSPECVAHLLTLGRPLSNFSAFNTRWRMPYIESHGTSNMWYSFNHGPAHFVSLDTETDWPGAEEEGTGDSHIPFLRAGSFGASGEYLRWLEQDLAAADGARRSPGGRPWIIAGGHRPFSEIEKTHGGLFRKYGVDAYFAGHSHHYARQEHVFAAGPDGAVSEFSTTDAHPPPRSEGATASFLDVIVGGAGCEEMEQAPRSSARGHGLGSFSTHRYASGVLSLNRTSLHWSLIDSVDGVELDAVVRIKAQA